MNVRMDLKHFGFLTLVFGLTTSVCAAQPDLGFTWKPVKDKLIVASVRPSSAAAEGKFQKEDVVTQVEGVRVDSSKAFDAHLTTFEAGSRLKIAVTRQGLPLTLGITVPLADRPPSAIEDSNIPGQWSEGITWSETLNKWMKHGQPFQGEARRGDQGMVVANGEVMTMRYYGPEGHVASEMTYQQGRPFEGRSTVFAAKGWKMNEVTYQNGHITGGTDYAPEGHKVQETTYDKSGNPTSYRYFDPSGRLASTVTIRDLNMDGVMSSFHPNGHKSEEREWRNGVEIRHAQWHPDGTPVAPRAPAFGQGGRPS